jgi:NADH-quinone oxidoreductase subunit N
MSDATEWLSAPPVEWSDLAPVIIVLGAAVVATLVEAFAPRWTRRPIQVFISLIAVAGSGVWAFKLAAASRGETGLEAAAGSVAVDPMTLYIQIALAVCGFLGLLVIADKTNQGEDAFAPSAAAASPAGVCPAEVCSASATLPINS